MSTTWFTADPHLQHNLMSSLRGFADTRKHDAAIVDAWHDQVATEDIVWVLGDVTLGDQRTGLQKISELPGTKHLIVGNHDRCFPTRVESYEHQRLYLGVFETVQLSTMLKVGAFRVLLSHFPYTDGGIGGRPDKFTQWRLRDQGRPLVHGHTHAAETWSSSPSGTPQIHVGWDAWGRLVSKDEVAGLLPER